MISYLSYASFPFYERPAIYETNEKTIKIKISQY